MIRRRIGIFGGTFDPIHIGHLRMALELKSALSLDELRLMPCFSPVYRDQPRATHEQRREMLLAAVNGVDELVIDWREFDRDHYTYSFDSLTELRAEVGAATSLVLCIGADSFVNLASWHRWQELTNLAHIVVASRPGWSLDHEALSCGMRAFYESHKGDLSDIETLSHGKIVIIAPRLLEISSTHIRAARQAGESARFLVPDAVLTYMDKYDIYRV